MGGLLIERLGISLVAPTASDQRWHAIKAGNGQEAAALAPLTAVCELIVALGKDGEVMG